MSHIVNQLEIHYRLAKDDEELDDENDDNYNLGDIQEDAEDASLLNAYPIYTYFMPDLNDKK